MLQSLTHFYSWLLINLCKLYVGTLSTLTASNGNASLIAIFSSIGLWYFRQILDSGRLAICNNLNDHSMSLVMEIFDTWHNLLCILRCIVIIPISYIVAEMLLVRPSDIVVGWLGFTAIRLLSFIFFSSATLWARWTELNQNRPHAGKWVRFENACPKSTESSPPKNWGPKTTVFDDFAT